MNSPMQAERRSVGEQGGTILKKGGGWARRFRDVHIQVFVRPRWGRKDGLGCARNPALHTGLLTFSPVGAGCNKIANSTFFSPKTPPHSHHQ